MASQGEVATHPFVVLSLAVMDGLSHSRMYVGVKDLRAMGFMALQGMYYGQ